MLTGAPHRSPWMDDELALLRETAREFFRRESVPHQERWAAQKHVDREFWNKAGEVGLLCASIPIEYGGGGGTFAHETVILEEQARAADSAFGNGVHSPIVASAARFDLAAWVARGRSQAPRRKSQASSA